MRRILALSTSLLLIFLFSLMLSVVVPDSLLLLAGLEPSFTEPVVTISYDIQPEEPVQEVVMPIPEEPAPVVAQRTKQDEIDDILEQIDVLQRQIADAEILAMAPQVIVAEPLLVDPGSFAASIPLQLPPPPAVNQSHEAVETSASVAEDPVVITETVVDARVELNTATLEQLDIITGVGPVIAQRIVAARPFVSVDDLLRVKGIGDKTLQKIKDQGLAYVAQTPPLEP